MEILIFGYLLPTSIIFNGKTHIFKPFSNVSTKISKYKIVFYFSGWTISVAQKSCALGYYTFAHELGHNFGCHHDAVNADNTYFSYGHGHHIEQGSASTGFRTILAYSASNHQTRVNYYSNPAVLLPLSGTPTGVAGVSNNAKVIRDNRFAFASLGDESATCSDGTVSTSAPTNTSTGACGNCVFPFTVNGRISDRCTTIDGDSQPWCFTSNGGIEYCTDSSCPGLQGNSPPITVHPENEAGKCCKS